MAEKGNPAEYRPRYVRGYHASPEEKAPGTHPNGPVPARLDPAPPRSSAPAEAGAARSGEPGAQAPAPRRQNRQASLDRTWLSRTVFPDGEEPDARFTLANERTFLSWTRTSLAFMAGGVAIEAFPIEGLAPQLRLWLAVATIFVGMLIAIGAAARWWRVENAMRHNRALPVPGIIPLLSVSAIGVCVLMLVVLLG